MLSSSRVGHVEKVAEKVPSVGAISSKVAVQTVLSLLSRHELLQLSHKVLALDADCGFPELFSF